MIDLRAKNDDGGYVVGDGFLAEAKASAGRFMAGPGGALLEWAVAKKLEAVRDFRGAAIKAEDLNEANFSNGVYHGVGFFRGEALGIAEAVDMEMERRARERGQVSPP